MKWVIALVVLTIFLQYSAVAQDCSSYTSCSDCTANATCGWCGPTQTCSVGAKQGPATGKCYGDAWFWGAGSCPNCSSFTNCKSCMYFESDCAWCSSDETCVEWGTKLGCGPVDYCPCDNYGTCSECLEDPQCSWCNTTCKNINDPTCLLPAHSCPCSDNADCDSCFADSQSGCVWCEEANGGPGYCGSSSTQGCLIAHSCTTYCATLGSDCDVCNSLPGCGWCDSSSTCVDASVSSCMVTHSCPDCGSHRYCDPCLDTQGCTWCSNGECRRTGETNGCMIQHTCYSYCQGYGDCEGCNAIPGCGWCEDGQNCVDVDKSSCLYAHSCSPIEGEKCGFDGGAFVGGMFLGIGLVAIGVGAYLFYKWKMGGKASYRELH